MLRQRTRFVPLEEKAAEGEIAPERDSGLYEAVMGLDVKYRVPFVLYYIEGFRTREIASMLKLPEGTVKTRLRRAREILRTELEGACYA